MADSPAQIQTEWPLVRDPGVFELESVAVMWRDKWTTEEGEFPHDECSIPCT